jgi:hypothetical protein
MGKMRNVTQLWWERLNGKDHLADLGVDWRTILKWFIKMIIRVWTGFPSDTLL